MRKKLCMVLSILIGIPIIITVIIYVSLSAYYCRTFMSGVMVNNLYVAGQTPEELNDTLLQKLEEPSFVIVDKAGIEHIVPVQEMEFTYSYLPTLLDIKKEQNPLYWGKTLVSGNSLQYNIAPNGSCNQKKLNAYLDEMSMFKEQADVKNIKVEIHKDDDGYYLIDDTQNLLMTDIAKKEIYKAIEAGDKCIDLKEAHCYEEVEYNAKMKEVLCLFDKINKIQQCHITIEFYNAEVDLTKEDICDFISVEENNEVKEVLIDKVKVAEYVEKLANQYDTINGPWTFHPTRGGIVTINKGTYGYKLNQKKQTEAIIELLNEGIDSELDAIYEQIGNSSKTFDIGDTYIEVDMSQQKLYYYEGGKKNLSTSVVTGNISRNNGTPERVCYVYFKQRNRVLRGADYETPVSYWMAVYGNIGIHDANWRGSFGGEIYKTNGSHGCINTPTAKIAKLYDRVSIGTPVVMFY